MKKNSFFFNFFAFFLLLFINQFAFSSSSQSTQLHGKKLSDRIYKSISSEKIQCEKQALLNGKNDFFPSNIIAHISSSKNFSNKIIFAFKAEDFEENEAFFKALSKALKESKKQCNIDILWTIGDNSQWEKDNFISGINSFISKINDTTGLCAVSFNFINDRSKIIPGSGGDVSPSWLLKLASDSFYSSKLSYNIKGGVISSLYRINALEEDENTALFIKAKIPSIGISLCKKDLQEDGSKKSIETILKMAENYNPEKSEYWDRHTNQLSIGSKTFWLSEQFTLISFSLIIFVSLFVICEFSFVFRKHRKLFMKEITSLWYFIPLCAATTFLCFMIGQFVSHLFLKYLRINPFSAISIKIFTSFFIYSIASVFFINLKSSISDRTYSFLQMISALLNIFIFSSIDISLFYLFAAEYIIVNVSRSFRRLIILSIFFLVMIIPFAPYGYQIVRYAKPEAVISFLSITPKFNLLFALGFMPFNLMWMRILSRLNKHNSKIQSKEKLLIKNISALSIALFSFALILFFFSKSIPERYRAKTFENKGENLKADEENLIQISYKDSVFFGETTRTLKIQLKKECRNCSVILKGNKKNPVLYSQCDYSSDAYKNTDYFKLSEYPPENLYFDYISSNETDTTVLVKCVFEDDENVVWTKEYSIPSRQL